MISWFEKRFQSRLGIDQQAKYFQMAALLLPADSLSLAGLPPCLSLPPSQGGVKWFRLSILYKTRWPPLSLPLPEFPRRPYWPMLPRRASLARSPQRPPLNLRLPGLPRPYWPCSLVAHPVSFARSLARRNSPRACLPHALVPTVSFARSLAATLPELASLMPSSLLRPSLARSPQTLPPSCPRPCWELRSLARSPQLTVGFAANRRSGERAKRWGSFAIYPSDDFQSNYQHFRQHCALALTLNDIVNASMRNHIININWYLISPEIIFKLSKWSKNISTN